MKQLLLISLVVVIMVGCGKDEDPDIRDQAIGTYNYSSQIYQLDGSSLQNLGPDFYTTGTMILSKGSNSNTIIFSEGGSEEFRAEKITPASNGFTFDVPSQSFDLDAVGVTITIDISGYNGVELDGVKYHGLYYSSNKEIDVFFQFEDTADNTFIIELNLTHAS